MASKIILKKSSVASKVPLVADLDYGELALNYTDGILYYKNVSNAVTAFSSAWLGGTVTNAVYVNNSTSSTSSTTGALKVAGGLGVAENLNVGGTVNKLTLTAPATGATLTIADAKTISFPQSLTFPSTAGTANYVLKTDGAGVLSWTAQTGGGSAATSGTATIDFGAHPGTNEASIAVIAQTAIAATSVVTLNVLSSATSVDHTASDHAYFTTFAVLTSNTPTAGTGFTITARSHEKLTGKWTLNWSWI